MNGTNGGFAKRGVVLVVALLAGCASGPRIERTQVTSFDDWAALPVDKTYVFARTLEFENSLEVGSYEGLVRDELASRGFMLVAEARQAGLVVTLRPSVTGTAVSFRERWPVDPFWGGPYGFSYGRFGYGPFTNFGGFYDGFRDSRIEIFKRRLELDIDSRLVAGKRFYEGRVESKGDDDALPRAMPTLVRALFADFPGNSGQTRRVDVPTVTVERSSR